MVISWLIRLLDRLSTRSIVGYWVLLSSPTIHKRSRPGLASTNTSSNVPRCCTNAQPTCREEDLAARTHPTRPASAPCSFGAFAKIEGKGQNLRGCRFGHHENRPPRFSFSVPASDARQSQFHGMHGTIKNPPLFVMLVVLFLLHLFSFTSFNHQGVPSRILLDRPALF